MQRRKGAAAEREICKLLSDELGLTVQRNIGQARSGGADCLELPGFALEIKRQESLSRPAWWRQAVKQGEKARLEPLVAYRRNGEAWRFLRVHRDACVDVSWDEGMEYIREKLTRLFAIYPEIKT